ncbi:response regulator [Spirochaetota bacterium]
MEDEGYSTHICESAFDAMSKLKAYDFNLVISEIELPGDNAFDLYNYLNSNYPYIPTIMTTNKNIDKFFEKIMEEGIGNVLCKPIKKDELLNLAEKLITKENIFGLNNYMDDIIEIKKIRISSSKQIQNAINKTLEEIEKWGFNPKENLIVNLILNELAINAVYHSHGLTKEKNLRTPVQLNQGQFVDLFFAWNKFSYGISINDYNGKLTKMKILESIMSIIKQDNLIEEAAETGEDITQSISVSGRGIDLVRKLSSQLFFIIKENFRTEIALIFEKDFHIDEDSHSSLKIIEDFGN